MTGVQTCALPIYGFQATYVNKYETRVGYLGFTWYLGATKPSKKIESGPQSGGGGFGS